MGVFKGIFTRGEFTRGEVAYVDGSRFKGTMQDRRKHGPNCEFVLANGDKFTGEFGNDEYKQGTFESRSGLRYEGAFEKGMKEGKGKYFLKGVAEYDGEFHQDEFHGYGKLKNFKNNT